MHHGIEGMMGNTAWRALTILVLAWPGTLGWADDALTQRRDQIFPERPVRVADPLARQLLAKPMVRCKGPLEVFTCDPELYLWAFKHPIWVKSLWDRLGVPVGEITKTPKGYHIRVDAKQSVEITMLAQEPGQNVILCKGIAKSPLLPRNISAQMVVVHRYRFQKLSNGHDYVAQQVEGFASIDGPAMRALVGLAPHRSETVAEISAREVLGFFSLMARILQARPDWGQEQVPVMTRYFPSAQVREFSHLVHQLEPAGGRVLILPPPKPKK